MKSLLKHVPESAQAVVALDLGSIDILKKFFDRIPEMKRELSEYLRRTVGLDLTEFNGAALFVTKATPQPTGAAFIRLKRGGTLRGRRIAGHQGVKIVSVEGKKLVAASVRGGLVLGDMAGIKQAIELARGKARPLGADPRWPRCCPRPAAASSSSQGCTPPASPSRRCSRWRGSFGVKLGLAHL